MLHIICGVVLVHFALVEPMEPDIQRRGAETKRAGRKNVFALT